MKKLLAPMAVSALAFGCFSPCANGAIIVADRNAFVITSPATGTPSTASGLEVAARGGAFNRKVYLGFDLSSLPELGGSESFSGVSLSLTFTGSPLIGAAPGSASYSLPLELYAIVDNTAPFTASAITWNNAPKNDTESDGGFQSSGVVSLGVALITVSPSAGTELPNTTVTWSGEGLSQLLNWAAGGLGDVYGTGVTSADFITLMIGSNATTSQIGVRFHSLTSAGANEGYKPTVSYEVIPEPTSFALLAVASGGVVMRLRSKRRAA